MATFEQAKALLEKEGTNTGTSVFDHLSGVILKILNESPDDPVASFEALSLSVKKSTYSQSSGEGAQLALSDEAKAAQVAAANSTLAKLAVGEDGPTEGAEVQDLLGDSSLLEWAGVNIGQTEAYELSCFMKTLVAKEAAPEDESDPVTINKIRFWGKILGSKGVDYYIYECQCDDRNIEIPEGVRMEGVEGVNRLTYYVVQSSNMEKYYRLPDVTEEQIVVARQLKKFMTGDLKAPVSGYPPFAGNEASFLRAQIACISADTLVAPTGFFDLSAEEEGPIAVVSKMVPDDEGNVCEAPAFDGLGSLDMWSHFEIPISAKGRMQAPPMVEGPDGEVPDPFYGEPEELRSAVSGLAEDMNGEEPNWKVQQCPSAGGPGSVSVVYSNQWPGAVAVACAGQRKFVNCYIGYGVLAADKTYTPPALPSLQNEFSGAFVEQADVTEAPVVEAVEEDE